MTKNITLTLLVVIIIAIVSFPTLSGTALGDKIVGNNSIFVEGINTIKPLLDGIKNFFDTIKNLIFKLSSVFSFSPPLNAKYGDKYDFWFKKYEFCAGFSTAMMDDGDENGYYVIKKDCWVCITVFDNIYIDGYKYKDHPDVEYVPILNDNLIPDKDGNINFNGRVYTLTTILFNKDYFDEVRYCRDEILSSAVQAFISNDKHYLYYNDEGFFTDMVEDTFWHNYCDYWNIQHMGHNDPFLPPSGGGNGGGIEL